jgi:predicted AAA+ superfamily ATPase
MTTILSFNIIPEIPYIHRFFSVERLLGEKSHFLLGPRQTGKTSLISRAENKVRVFDLLDSTVFLDLSVDPGRLEAELEPGDRYVVIDEIQRLPGLLHEVHRLIEKRKIRFLLTGSSARKLRRGGVNLLGGRARIKYFHPFTRKELGKHFSLDRVMLSGLLPPMYHSPDPEADLEAYSGLYLREEIVAEAATRNVPAFSRFLKVAAQCNGTIVNYTNIANDAQVPRTTVYEYFEILKDTLIIHELPAWKKSSKRKPIVSSKHYFFDVGVVSSLQGRTFVPGTTEYGEAFETYIAHELRAYADYVSGEPLHFWKAVAGFEVDFILGDHTAVELKAKRTVSKQDIRSLEALSEENKLKNYLCVCLDTRPRTIGKVRILPYGDFLDKLWDGEFRG